MSTYTSVPAEQELTIKSFPKNHPTTWMRYSMRNIAWWFAESKRSDSPRHQGRVAKAMQNPVLAGTETWLFHKVEVSLDGVNFRLFTMEDFNVDSHVMIEYAKDLGEHLRVLSAKDFAYTYHKALVGIAQ